MKTTASCTEAARRYTVASIASPSNTDAALTTAEYLKANFIEPPDAARIKRQLLNRYSSSEKKLSLLRDLITGVRNPMIDDFGNRDLRNLKNLFESLGNNPPAGLTAALGRSGNSASPTPDAGSRGW